MKRDIGVQEDLSKFLVLQHNFEGRNVMADFTQPVSSVLQTLHTRVCVGTISIAT